MGRWVRNSVISNLFRLSQSPPSLYLQDEESCQSCENQQSDGVDGIAGENQPEQIDLAQVHLKSDCRRLALDSFRRDQRRFQLAVAGEDYLSVAVFKISGTAVHFGDEPAVESELNRSRLGGSASCRQGREERNLFPFRRAGNRRGRNADHIQRGLGLPAVAGPVDRLDGDGMDPALDPVELVGASRGQRSRPVNGNLVVVDSRELIRGGEGEKGSAGDFIRGRIDYDREGLRRGVVDLDPEVAGEAPTARLAG